MTAHCVAHGTHAVSQPGVSRKIALSKPNQTPVPYLFYIKADQRAREVERLSLRRDRRRKWAGMGWGVDGVHRP